MVLKTFKEKRAVQSGESGELPEPKKWSKSPGHQWKKGMQSKMFKNMPYCPGVL